MMRLCGAFVAVLMAFGAIGCTNVVEAPPYGVVDTREGPVRQVRLWAEDHPLLKPFDVVLDGCRAWWPADVDCILTDEADATIRIRAITPEDVKDSADQALIDLANCAEKTDGTRTIGLSLGAGNIQIFPKCYEQLDAEGNVVGYNTLVGAAVVTHEVGHELGLPHVPKHCDEPHLNAGSGDGLCGDAIMNPILDLATPAPTRVDDNLFKAFVDGIQLPDGTSNCNFFMK